MLIIYGRSIKHESMCFFFVEVEVDILAFHSVQLVFCADEQHFFFSELNGSDDG